jgi:hypothetical protein
MSDGYPRTHWRCGVAADSIPEIRASQLDPREGAMIESLKGLWQRYRTHRRHRLDIQAFNRLMDARAAARRAA